MNRIKPFVASIAVLAALVALGCASAYYDDPRGCLSEAYCPPSPLPFTTYDGCPTPVAAELAADFAVTPNEQPTYVQLPITAAELAEPPSDLIRLSSP